MQQSNAYIIGFSIALTVVLGTLLSVAAVGLKERQDKSKKLDTKKQILSAVMSIEGMTEAQLEETYAKSIRGMVVDFNGQAISTTADGKEVKPEGMGEFALSVDIKKQYKKKQEERLYPVFQFMGEDNPTQVQAYILPLFGNGLWDNIWGYLAVKQGASKGWDTIQGVSFDHKGETPGLGARITSLDVQQRFKDKKLFDDKGEFAVKMLKGEKNGVDDHPHNVDGMSGATITGNGVNDMMKDYVGLYKAFLEGLTKGAQAAL